MQIIHELWTDFWNKKKHTFNHMHKRISRIASQRTQYDAMNSENYVIKRHIKWDRTEAGRIVQPIHDSNDARDHIQN